MRLDWINIADAPFTAALKLIEWELLSSKQCFEIGKKSSMNISFRPGDLVSRHFAEQQDKALFFFLRCDFYLTFSSNLQQQQPVLFKCHHPTLPSLKTVSCYFNWSNPELRPI
jgi:hypothetical protein